MTENWVFIQSEPGLWTVGFYGPDKWMPESDHDNQESAAKRVNYLNGSIAQSHPGLASGALREALERIHDEDPDCRCEHGDEYCCEKVGGVFCARCIAARALSLSNPIEPRCTCPEEQTWEPITPCPVHDARPTSQASSEIREAQAWLASMTPRPEVIAVSSSVWGIKWKEQMVCAPTIVEAVAVLRDALAPSRQGAAKRVEG